VKRFLGFITRSKADPLTRVSIDHPLHESHEVHDPLVRPLIFNESIWKRNPPKREVVRITQVWWNADGWKVDAVPVRGGRRLVGSAEWFLANFTLDPPGD
jgi:hypothetical protein